MGNFMTFIVASAPALTAIIGVICAVIKNKKISGTIVDAFGELKNEVINTKEYTDLKAQLTITQRENAELKHKFNELLTKIDRLHRED